VAFSLRSASRSGGPLTPQTGTPGTLWCSARSVRRSARSVVTAGGCDAGEPQPATNPPARPPPRPAAGGCAGPKSAAVTRARVRRGRRGRPASSRQPAASPEARRPAVQPGRAYPSRQRTDRPQDSTRRRNGADRATFICHKRRCGKAYPARREKLDAAFRRALAEGRDRVCLPSDLRNGGPQVARPAGDLDGNRR
jgi:hypothetical protein